ncbi:hypothetical protein RFI_02694 [Reticulomyxa filosa]|uniref:Maestro/Maestro-like HEAT-repeats domain-containing protein n=1 Tax=Reticulomyxa filosa TaxID=46433 RepID=X6P8A7_RETFI|nr:hypothetical protein RFI_02694 [Reticulomyxa filosa]|eukprot:ETO34401.1 hypothetical protein RFI_02694 [Reticulomyxa filosa]
MRWNWIKCNGTKDKPNENTLFKTFEMEIDYLSQIAWEGLKCGQAIISCEIQQKVLNIVKTKYPRKHISSKPQWSRINAFELVQGYESWFAAYYLVNCLYQSNESESHKEVRSLLIDQQLTPKFSAIIPFMAGILYGNIENKSDSSGSGLSYFWSVLYSLPLQPSPIHQLMLYVRCLDACKADTSNSLLSSQLQSIHKEILHSFRAWIAPWINFNKDFRYSYRRGERTITRPLNAVMKAHLPHLQFVLVHPDIHPCLLEQLKRIKIVLQSQDYHNPLLERWGALIDGLHLLSYLCISNETTSLVVECFKLGFQRKFSDEVRRESHRAIFTKLKEEHLDDIIVFLMEGVCRSSGGDECADAFKAIMPLLNQRQLGSIFQGLENGFNNKTLSIRLGADLFAKTAVALGGKFLDVAFKCLATILEEEKWNISDFAEAFEMLLIKLNEKQFNEETYQFLIRGLNNGEEELRRLCAKVLATISAQLKETYFGRAVRSLIKGLNYRDRLGIRYCRESFETILEQLNEEQEKYFFQCLIDGLKNKHKYLCQRNAQLLGTLAARWSQVQLHHAFESLMNQLHTDVHWSYSSSMKKIAMHLKGESLNIAFQYAMNGLKHENLDIRKFYVDLLAAVSTQWNKGQFDKIFVCLMTNVSKDKDRHVRYSCAQAIQKLFLKLNEKQVNEVFDYLINGFHDANKNVHYSCAESLGKFARKFSPLQLSAAFQYFIERFNNRREDMLVRVTCAESLGKIATKLNQMQVNEVLKCLTNKLDDEKEDKFVRKYCAYSLEIILMELRKFGGTYVCVPPIQLVEENLIRFNARQATNTLIHLLNGPTYKKASLRFSCVEALAKLALKLTGKEFSAAFDGLINGCKDKNSKIRHECTEMIKDIVPKLDRGQLDEAFECLLNEFRDKNSSVRCSCAGILRTIALKLDEKRLDRILKCLIEGLNDEYGSIRDSCTDVIRVIALKLNAKQLNETFANLITGFIDENKEVRHSFAETLKTFVNEWNDTQLWLLVKNGLQNLKNSHRNVRLTLNGLLSELSNDMWKRLIIHVLKNPSMDRQSTQQNPLDENNEVNNNDNIEIQILAFGLWTYNPRLQLNFNDGHDNISADDFNTLIRYCNKQAIEWNFPSEQKWSAYEDVPYPRLVNVSNINKCKDRFRVACEAAQSGDITQLKFALEHYHFDINDAFDEQGYTPLLLAIDKKHWDIVRYCIAQGAWIDIRGSIFDSTTLQTPFECIVKKISKEKQKKKANMSEKEYSKMINTCKWMLRQRTIYPMEQIEYAIDYVKDRLTRVADDKSYKTLLQEGAGFLLGENQKELQETLTNNNLLYWSASRNVSLIESEKSQKKKKKKKRADEEWQITPFLILRIFLLFETCVRLKRNEKRNNELPMNITLEQVYEKGVKELQVQLTTYWDYLTTEEFEKDCPELIDDWSCNVVDRLMGLKSISSNECCEISLAVGHKKHCIYLSLCKTLTSILVRIDNRWMKTVPSNISPPKKIDNDCEWAQPYLVSYFQCSGSNVKQNKEWLKEYIKNATKLRDSQSKKSMKHLYCSDGNDFPPPREGSSPMITDNWPYCRVSIDANTCYLQNHDVGYRIRLGEAIFQWFCDQESKSFVFSENKKATTEF